MGLSSSTKKEKSQEKGLFAWQQLSSGKETIHYDPRFEDIAFTEDGLFISDFHDRIFEWESKLDEDQQPAGYHLKLKDNSPFMKYNRENASGSRSGKRFDSNATSLAWIANTVLYYLEVTNSEPVMYDVSEWIKSKYGDDTTIKIPSKNIINLGDGQILFMVKHSRPGSGQESGHILRGTDIVHMDIINEKEVKTISIENDLLKEKQNECVYWGFQLNPNGKEVSVLIKAANNVSYVCFVSLSDGSILWQSRFDFVHDLSFNYNGNFACVFERPRKTEFGYIHVLNLTRLEWICQIRLTYGTSPLGWDGFTWMKDSLVFMAPFEVKIVAPGAVEWRMTETEEQNEKERKLMEEIKRRQEQEQNESDDDDDDEDENGNGNDGGNNGNNGSNEQKVDDANVITPQKFDKILQQQKSKEICVLSIGERWWDLEPQTMDVVFQRVKDEHIARLILEYGGMSWAMIRFPYPMDDGTRDDDAMLMQGAQSECFDSGRCGDYNVLLLAKIARDPRTKIFNHWKFSACAVPQTFEEIWRNPNVQKGVIVGITDVEEQSNLKPLDAYE